MILLNRLIKAIILFIIEILLRRLIDLPPIPQKHPPYKRVFLVLVMSKSVSRVLYLIIIYLRLYISARLKPPARDWRATIMSLCGVAPGGVYIDRQVTMPLVSSYLTFPPLLRELCKVTLYNHHLATLSQRYISVALSLKSPSPGVTRHPALWSPDFPQVRPFGTVSAIIWLTQY